LLSLRDIRSQRDYEDLKRKIAGRFNVIEDHIDMPQPRIEIKKDAKETEEPTRRGFYSAICFKPNLRDQIALHDMDDLTRTVTQIQQQSCEETDYEIEDEFTFAEKLSGIMGEELSFRGQKFTFLQHASAFPAPPRDDTFMEALARQHVVLFCANSDAQGFEEQMFQFQKMLTSYAKLYGVCLIKRQTSPETLEDLKQKFSFADKLNLLTYKPGLFKHFY